MSHQSNQIGPLATRILLYSGIFSSLWYVFINVFVPTFYPGYSLSTYTVSELSAIDAPTRPLWVTLVIPYVLLFGVFGAGILQMAEQRRVLRVLGWLVIFYTLFNIYWPPMHMRGVRPTLTDTLHIVWASVTVLLMMLIMGLGAAAFGKRFKVLSIASMVVLILFGALTSLEAPNIPINGPTPMIGIWERINIGIFMVWVMVLATVLLRQLAVTRNTSVD